MSRCWYYAMPGAKSEMGMKRSEAMRIDIYVLGGLSRGALELADALAVQLPHIEWIRITDYAYRNRFGVLLEDGSPSVLYVQLRWTQDGQPWAGTYPTHIEAARDAQARQSAVWSIVAQVQAAQVP